MPTYAVRKGRARAGYYTDGEGYYFVQQSEENPAGDPHTYPVEPEEFIASKGLTLIRDSEPATSSETADEWRRRERRIFRYFFIYPERHRSLVLDFAASVKESWANTVQDGRIPSHWNESQAEDGRFLLEYNARLAEAVQYGRGESVARQTAAFEEVDYAKTMSPDVAWSGLELTDPRDGEKKTFEPGDLHRTSDADLRKRVRTTVTRSDLVAHWGLSFS